MSDDSTVGSGDVPSTGFMGSEDIWPLFGGAPPAYPFPSLGDSSGVDSILGPWSPPWSFPGTGNSLPDLTPDALARLGMGPGSSATTPVGPLPPVQRPAAEPLYPSLPTLPDPRQAFWSKFQGLQAGAPAPLAPGPAAPEQAVAPKTPGAVPVSGPSLPHAPSPSASGGGPVEREPQIPLDKAVAHVEAQVGSKLTKGQRTSVRRFFARSGRSVRDLGTAVSFAQQGDYSSLDRLALALPPPSSSEPLSQALPDQLMQPGLVDARGTWDRTRERADEPVAKSLRPIVKPFAGFLADLANQAASAFGGPRRLVDEGQVVDIVTGTLASMPSPKDLASQLAVVFSSQKPALRFGAGASLGAAFVASRDADSGKAFVLDSMEQVMPGFKGFAMKLWQAAQARDAGSVSALLSGAGLDGADLRRALGILDF